MIPELSKQGVKYNSAGSYFIGKDGKKVFVLVGDGVPESLVSRGFANRIK